MRKLSIFTIGLTGLTCLGVIAFIYQFWVGDTVKFFDQSSSSFEQQTILLTRSEAAAVAHRDAINQMKANQQNQSRQTDTAMVDYTLLPDMPETVLAKKFLMSIRKNGYLGEHATFQRSLDQLNTTQILSNMMLMKDDALQLKTVLISSNMLNRQQLEASFAMCQHLLQDLKLMYDNFQCTKEQEKVMNVAFARLTYLTRIFSFELKKYETTSNF